MPDGPRADAALPTATGEWQRDEVASPRTQHTPVETVRAQQAALRRCTAHGGTFATSVALSIDGDGHVTSVHFNGGDAATNACLEQAIRAMHFDGGPLEALIPFTE